MSYSVMCVQEADDFNANEAITPSSTVKQRIQRLIFSGFVIQKAVVLSVFIGFAEYYIEKTINHSVCTMAEISNPD